MRPGKWALGYFSGLLGVFLFVFGLPFAFGISSDWPILVPIAGFALIIWSLTGDRI